MNPSYIVVLVTAKDEAEARKISRALLEKKLIACANIVKGIDSLYWWEGKIDEAGEALLIIKSRADLFAKIVQEVKSLHSYSCPEVLALPVLDGNPDYLKWIGESTS